MAKHICIMENDPSVGNIWANAITFDTLPEALAMEKILREQGFETLVQNERRLQRFWFAAKDHGGIHLQVRSKDMARVDICFRALPEAQSLFRGAVHCPSCDSTRVQYPAMTRKNLLPALVAQALVLLGIQKHEFYCEECHFTWVPIERNLSPRAVNDSLKA